MTFLCVLILCCTIVGMLARDSTADTSGIVQGGFGFELMVTKFTVLEDRYTKMEELVDNKFNSLAYKIETIMKNEQILAEQVSNLSYTLEIVTKKEAVIDKTLSSVNYSVEKLTENETAVEKVLSYLNSTIETKKKKEELVDNKLNSLAYKIETIMKKLQALDEQVSSLSYSLEIVTKKEAIMDKTLGSVNYSVEKITKNEAAVEKVLNYLNSAMETNKNSFSLMDDRIYRLTNKLETIMKKEETIEHEVSSLKYKVDAIMKKAEVMEKLSNSLRSMIESKKEKEEQVDDQLISLAKLIQTLMDWKEQMEKKISSLSLKLKPVVEKTSISNKRVYRSCSEVPSSGTYTIQPDETFKEPFKVLCEKYNDQGWIVIQHRFDGSVNFYRSWKEYKNGFGYLDGEFWLGLERIHQLTASDSYELAVVLEDFDGNKRYAKYDQFEIGDKTQKYEVTTLGEYSGTAGDSFGDTEDMKFSTFDADNDMSESQCAVRRTGAWWYGSCSLSNLNGQYLRGETEEHGTGMMWYTFRGKHYALKTSKMMIRPN